MQRSKNINVFVWLLNIPGNRKNADANPKRNISMHAR